MFHSLHTPACLKVLTPVRNLSRWRTGFNKGGTIPRALASKTETWEDYDPESSICCIIDSVPGPDVESLVDTLMGQGAQAVSVEESRAGDAPEQKIFWGKEQQVWDSCSIKVHFPGGFDTDSVFEPVRKVYPDLSIRCTIKHLNDRNWVESVKASYQPIQVVEDWWILPEWCTAIEPDANNIILEPGLAFGTGDHPTTQLCIEQLVRLDLAGKHVVDYGTGSGVLALAALMKGADKAVGVDIDPLSVKAATRNAELNELEGRFKVLQCSPSLDDEEPLNKVGYPVREFDLCVANILKGPLLELCPRLSRYVKSGGHIILSGILNEQVESVMSAYSDYFTDLVSFSKDDWGVIVGTKL